MVAPVGKLWDMDMDSKVMPQGHMDTKHNPTDTITTTTNTIPEADTDMNRNTPDMVSHNKKKLKRKRTV